MQDKTPSEPLGAKSHLYYVDYPAVWYVGDEPLVNMGGIINMGDALCPHDIRKMDLLWDLTVLCHNYTMLFLVWVQVIVYLSISTKDQIFSANIYELVKPMTKVIELLWSKGYCYFQTV